MNRFICVGLLLASAAVYAKVPAEAGNPEDKQAILKLHSDFTEAWGKDDAQAIAKLFTAEGDLINPMGRAALGRDQVEKLIAEEHAGRLKGTVMTQSCDRVRFLTAEVAVVDCAFTVKGIQSQPDTLNGHITDVVIKDGGAWKFAVHRPMIPRRLPTAIPAGRRGPPIERD